MNTARTCVWPACLTDAEQDGLAAEVIRQMNGEPPSPPPPDPRPQCGCTQD